jgi:hypothetical protein
MHHASILQGVQRIGVHIENKSQTMLEYLIN